MPGQVQIDCRPIMMVYEIDGPATSVEGRPSQPSRELHRLEYRSQTEWVDTLIETTRVHVSRPGVGGFVGSYRSLNGEAVAEYDAMTRTTDDSTVSENGIFVPNSALVPYYPDLLDAIPGMTKSRVVTSAKVCFNGDCEENAVGVLYRSDRRIWCWWTIPVPSRSGSGTDSWSKKSRFTISGDSTSHLVHTG